MLPLGKVSENLVGQAAFRKNEENKWLIIVKKYVIDRHSDK